MRRYQQGDCVRVTVSRREVESFARRWPCFGRIGPLSFTFQRDGALVDLTGDGSGMDLAGVAALADDAGRYAVTRNGRHTGGYEAQS